MEKVLKIVKIITVTLMIILLSVIAFCGIYGKENNVWKKITPEFNYGIELGRIRELRYAVDTSEEEKNVYVDENGKIMGEVKEAEESTEESADEEKKEQSEEKNKVEYKTEKRIIKANEEEVKTKENFEKTKKLITQRLENEDVYEYNIRLDDITGELILEVPNDDTVSIAHTAVTSVGEFEIVDDQTGVILINREDIKKINNGMYQTENGYQACLQIIFNDVGKEKLKNISNKYRQVVDDAGQSETSYVAVNVDGQTISKTYFGEELPNGLIQIPIGQETSDSETLNLYVKEAGRMVNEINEEKLPIVYSLSSDVLIESRITNESKIIFAIVFAALILIISIVLIVKFKTKGLVSSILSVGFVAIFSLAIRYTKTYVTLNSIIAFTSVIMLNYVFLVLLLSKLKDNENVVKEVFLDTMKKYYLMAVPVCIIAIVFTFASNIVISSIGMIVFWGLLLQVLYNAITILGLGLI